MSILGLLITNLAYFRIERDQMHQHELYRIDEINKKSIAFKLLNIQYAQSNFIEYRKEAEKNY